MRRLFLGKGKVVRTNVREKKQPRVRQRWIESGLCIERHRETCRLSPREIFRALACIPRVFYALSKFDASGTFGKTPGKTDKQTWPDGRGSRGQCPRKGAYRRVVSEIRSLRPGGENTERIKASAYKDSVITTTCPSCRESISRQE